MRIAPDIPLTKADPEKMRRGGNLAGNAVKFTDKGGKVEILAEHDPEAGEILISVSDTEWALRKNIKNYF